MNISDGHDYDQYKEATLKAQEGVFCTECGLEIAHKGTSEYCSIPCMKENILRDVQDTFRAERDQLSANHLNNLIGQIGGRYDN